MPDDYTDQSGNGDGDGASPEVSTEASPDKENQNVVTLPPDMLPPGTTPKDGDRLTFCVHGEPDENGVKGYFETPKMQEEDWESGFKKSMSARESGNDDQPM